MKYADAVGGGLGISMVVRISGGRDTGIELPFVVFKNDRLSYPVRGVLDDIPGASYRSRLKGWMDTTVMPQ